MALSIVETCFCDPFASWQKGGVENANKLKLLTKWRIGNLIIRIYAGFANAKRGGQ